MALLQALTTLFEEEMDKKINIKMTKYVEYISKTYDISLKLLLRDLEKIDELSAATATGSESAVPLKPGHCIGICVNGKRCSRKAKNGAGFCKIHTGQTPTKPILVKQHAKCGGGVEHNHTIPPLFSKNCPACAVKNGSRDNLLIDI